MPWNRGGRRRLEDAFQNKYDKEKHVIGGTRPKPTCGVSSTVLEVLPKPPLENDLDVSFIKYRVNNLCCISLSSDLSE